MLNRDEVARQVERLEVEQELNRRLQIALDRYGFSTCSGWDGKEMPAKTVWDALIDSELRIQELREALQNSARLLGELYWEICEDAVETGNQRISKWAELVRAEALLSEEKK